ncbi:hypothetical protein [Cognatilysobacter lacus]|uniref:ATP-grasp domain-containing protein n=1 Tax=Cognatilysobacter lacus TaxID=1643323 RepID=A0A5D8Z2S0_9GAMM|nr:hypothetical protein [Lysobacter lacus]TZF89295.1 hypothetical protein FW784_08875 [Lysobacter lacus]
MHDSVAGAPPAATGRFEQLPKALNLIPMVAQWLWLGLRYGSLTLPSCANPGITSGGLVGEGKLEYFRAMGPLARSATAEHVDFVAGECTRDDVLAALADAGISLPAVAKPDVGWCGYGVRLLHDTDDIDDYLRRFPDGHRFLLQRYLSAPGEAGLFYVREPDATSGRLLGILLRHYPAVTGNGRDSVATLVQHDERLQRALRAPGHELRFDPDYVPTVGERMRLSTVASTRVGGAYADGSEHATAALTARVDAIARDMGEFHVGRFDVRYESLDALRAGDFRIMEVNGAGSEAVHAWDPKYSIRDVYRIVFEKQRLLFRISAANRARGRRPISALALARLYLAQQRAIALYPPSN